MKPSQWGQGDYPLEPWQVVPIRKRDVPRLMEAQRSAGITVDGVLGPQTWCAIFGQPIRSTWLDLLVPNPLRDA